MPFGVLCYCLMWSTLSDATPASLKFLWYLFMYSFFQTCMTVRNTVPEALSDTSSCTVRDGDRVSWAVPASPGRDRERWVVQDGRGWDGTMCFNAGDSAGLPVRADVNFPVTGLWEHSKSQQKRVKSHQCTGVTQVASLPAVCRDEEGVTTSKPGKQQPGPLELFSP